MQISQKNSFIIAKAMAELDSLIDSDSEFRFVNRNKTLKILVDKSCMDIGNLIIYEKHKYIEVHKRLGESPNYKTRSLGRILLNLNDPSKISEHKNGNPLDNRLCNLRICSQGQNVKNRKPFSLKSKYKGLSIEDKKISVEIQNEYVLSRIYFNQDILEKLAAVVYDCLAVKIHGEYSRLNFDRSKYTKEIVDFIYDLVSQDITTRTKPKK